MKRFFYTMFYIILSVSVNGQNIIEQLKTFSQNADMDCYYKMIEKNVNIYFKQEYEHRGYWAYCSNCSSIEILKDSGGYRLASHLVSYLTGKDDIVSDTTRIVPILRVQFINTDRYKEGDNLYDYMCLDSTVVFSLASVDRKNRVKAYLHFFNSYSGYIIPKEEPRWCESRSVYYKKNVLNKIKAKNPDLIMSAVFIETPHLLYVKDGLIFVYNHEKDVSTELNEYVRKRYKRVSLLSVVRIPYIYAKLIGELTTTGHTPKDRINLCP